MLVKAVDFEDQPQDGRPGGRADRRDTGRSGCGRLNYDGNRYGITLEEQPAADGAPGLTLDKNTVFLVTGAAGASPAPSSAIWRAASGGIFYLLDLVALPDAERRGACSAKRQRSAQAAVDRRGESGRRKPTPAQIDKQIIAIERQEAACVRSRRCSRRAAWRTIAASTCSTARR
ncbi:MAG: hypothetical protein U0521_18725 [Anaerolineae bacterium]